MVLHDNVVSDDATDVLISKKFLMGRKVKFFLLCRLAAVAVCTPQSPGSVKQAHSSTRTSCPLMGLMSR
jgi:hypothetical protein